MRFQRNVRRALLALAIAGVIGLWGSAPPAQASASGTANGGATVAAGCHWRVDYNNVRVRTQPNLNGTPLGQVHAGWTLPSPSNPSCTFVAGGSYPAGCGPNGGSTWALVTYNGRRAYVGWQCVTAIYT